METFLGGFKSESCQFKSFKLPIELLIKNAEIFF